jgi:hypothetical protein
MGIVDKLRLTIDELLVTWQSVANQMRFYGFAFTQATIAMEKLTRN